MTIQKKVKVPDGEIITLNVPDNASEADILANAKKLHEQQIAAKAAKDSSGESVFSDFTKSLPTGFLEGLMEAASASGKGAAIEMGQSPEEIPNADAATKIFEQQVTGPLHQPQNAGGRIGKTVGEFLGNPASYVAPGGLPMKATQAAVSGLGSGGLGELLKGTKLEPYGRFIGGFVGGAGTGAAEAERNISSVANTLPNLEKYRTAAKAGYKQLEQSNTRINEAGAQDLASTIREQLTNQQFRKYNAKDTFKSLQELEKHEELGISDISNIRQLFTRGTQNVTKPNDAEASRRAVSIIDDWLADVSPDHIKSGDPALDAAILKHAQGNWRVVRQLEDVKKAGTIALHRAGVSGTGANMINTQRQEIRKILDSEKKSKGLSQAVKDKMEEIVMGTWLTNRARWMSKYAPSGPVSGLTALLTGMKFGPEIGGAVAVTGLLSKYMGSYLTDRQLKELSIIIRGEGPIGKPVMKDLLAKMGNAKASLPSSVARATTTSAAAAEEKQQ